MGLEDADLLEDGDGGGKTSSLVSCSICLEAVTDNGDRSWSKLHCGHQFHLDCIGSAFNVKGVMQCPNCRKIEKGQWLFANGCRSFPEFNMDDWAHDEDLYDLSYSEMNDDVAYLEWLSKFVEDTFSNYPQINVTGTSPAPSNTTTWTSTLESITPTVAKSKPHMIIECTKIKREVYSSSYSTLELAQEGYEAATTEGDARRRTTSAAVGSTPPAIRAPSPP